jgi:hypothetical protein
VVRPLMAGSRNSVSPPPNRAFPRLPRPHPQFRLKRSLEPRVRPRAIRPAGRFDSIQDNGHISTHPKVCGRDFEKPRTMRPQRLSLVGVPIRLFRSFLLARLSGAPLGIRKHDVAAASTRMRLLQSVPDPYDGLSKSVDLARTIRCISPASPRHV